MRKKIVALFLAAAMLMSFVPFTLTASAAIADDNTVMFSANDDADGKLYYNGYYTYGENGLGYTQKGLLKNSKNNGPNTSDGHAYLFADEIDGENMWKITFDVNENGNHVKTSGGGTYIYPFYSDTNNPNTKDGAIAAADIETLGDNSDKYGDISEYTHLAIRVKFINDGTGNYKEGSTQPLSINLLDAASGDGAYGSWNKGDGVYFQDVNTGEKIKVNKDVMQIPVGFDGYLVFPTGAVSGTDKTLADLVKVHIFLHWNCKHTSPTYDANNSWVGTELYVGDMILTKNINSFNLVYGAPSFDVTSNDESITVISDDANAIYSFDKNAEAAKWMTKEQFNAAAKDLPRGTNYTVYAKYATGTRIVSKEIATTNTGIAGYLMEVPQEDTYLSYNGKYIGWGSKYLVKTSGADPFSNSGYASGSSQGLFVRKPEGSNEHFIVLNTSDTANETTGIIPESNVGLCWNTISGRGLDVAEDGTKTVKTGMPEYINKDSLKAIAIRLKITGGTADQYSSFSFYLSGIKDYLQVSRGYLIDNTTGLVMNPYFQSNSKGHLFNLKGEFDGWLVLPYEYIFAGHRKYLETTGGSIAVYIHTSGCNVSDHGKDTASDWTNKILWMGNIALVDDEEAFINAHSRPVTDSEGMVFTSNDYHTIGGTFTQMTNTFEAWVKFPQNYPKNIRGGQMLSNSGNARDSITYQILANGNPSVSTTKYSYGTSKSSETKTFDQVNVYNGEWTHLAIVNDQANNTITCYVNGVAAQTLEGALADSINTVAAGVLGGNFSPGNVLAFRGEMKELALYSDVRTADEIKADMNAVGADDLMAHWDLSEDAVDGKLIDKSGNNHDVTLGKVWFDSDVDSDDYDYSFAIVGDTQYVNYNWNDRYDDIYDWIVENKDTKKIKYVMNMGDITENSADAQWQRAVVEHAKLDAAKIPYSLVRGNHDKTDGFNATFNKAPYNTSYTESFDKKIENTYRELTVGNIKYLIFTLDIGASDEVLEWAGNVVEAHPQHNVIFTTHVYLDKNGVPMDSKYNGAPTNSTYAGGGNDADEMWDKLFGKYENVVMVLCGHVSAETAVRTERIGVNGNVVTQMLVDPQGTDNSIGATGMVTMLNFSEDGSKVSVETYSTVRDMHYKTQGQYDFTIPVIKHTHSGGTATCNAKAVCDYCKEAYGDFDPTKHGTNTELKDVVKPDCKNDGYTGDTWCKDCNTKIADGKKDPATGAHVDADGKWETDGTNHWHTCGCGTEFDKTAHAGGTATCKDKKVCDTCKAAYGEVDAKAHGTNTELKGVVAAECGKPGYTGDTWCKDCNTEIAKGKATDALTHKGGEATCKEKAICDLCKAAYGEVNAENHKNTELKNKKDATCAAEGYTGDTWCKDCEKEVKKGETIKKLDHVAADELKDAKPATTTEKGYTGDKVCKDCGEVLEEGKEIPVIVEDNKTEDDKTEGDNTTGGEGTDNDNAGAGSEDDGTTAPETGDSASVLVAVLVALMAGAVVVLAKKRANN